jgi:hypothetical protein
MMSAAIQPVSMSLLSAERCDRGMPLDAAQAHFQSHADGPDRASLEEAAAELVSSAFVLPMLEGMNSSPLRPQDGPFAMSSAEKRFSPLLFQFFSDRVVKSANFSLVRSIADRYATNSAKEMTDVRA